MSRGLSTSAMGVLTVLLSAAVAGAQPSAGDRMLLDVGVCWDGGAGTPGYGPVNAPNYHDDNAGGAHGSTLTPATDGNYWNNFSAGGGGAISLVNTAGTDTGVSLDMTRPWSNCSDYGNAFGTAEVSGLYLPKAQTDCRWWPVGKQPAQVTLGALDPALTYDILVYGYVCDATTSDSDITGDPPLPYPGLPGSELIVNYTIGAQTVPLDVLNNTTTCATFTGVSPDVNNEIVITIASSSPADCGAPLNVIDITVVPEPATIALLGLGFAGLAALRRRRK